ncbi:ATP-binding protein [Kitasatospora sp. NPDC058190]|uniref:ATP-binding protein n=1 Tax=Kitasatospora sp. NPDC058190 TaxID=3346371 RepID=UPI0036DC5DD1
MSVLDTALRESLKSLRLSGMLETLDARLAQAHGGELGHLDFLQVLCQDERERRESVAFERRLRKAKFEQQVTLEGFDFNASPKLPAAQIRDLAALRWLHAGESVMAARSAAPVDRAGRMVGMRSMPACPGRGDQVCHARPCAIRLEPIGLRAGARWRPASRVAGLSTWPPHPCRCSTRRFQCRSSDRTSDGCMRLSCESGRRRGLRWAGR